MSHRAPRRKQWNGDFSVPNLGPGTHQLCLGRGEGGAGEMQLGMIGPVTPGTARASSEHPG